MTSEAGSVDIGRSEVINDDLFVGAQTANIGGTVNGDVFVGAQTVKVTGVINGNLHVGANTVDLQGAVTGNVYAGGQSVIVDGATIGGSILAGGASVSLDNKTTVGGSVLVGGGVVTLDSQVKRSVYAGTGSLTINSDAKIGKDLYYSTGDSQANIASGATILGTTHKSEVKAPEKVNTQVPKEQVMTFLNGFKFTAKVVSFLGMLIVGFLYFKFFPKHLAGSVALTTNSFWKSFGVGFLVTIAIVPALIVALLTIVGIPVAGIAFLLFMLYSVLAKVVVGFALGKWIVSKVHWKLQEYAAFAVGLFAVYVLKMIPVVSFFTGLVVFWLGLGALTLRTFSKSE